MALKLVNTNIEFKEKCRKSRITSALIQFQVTAAVSPVARAEEECQKLNSLTQRCLCTDSRTTADKNIYTMVPLYCSKI